MDPEEEVRLLLKQLEDARSSNDILRESLRQIIYAVDSVRGLCEEEEEDFSE